MLVMHFAEEVGTHGTVLVTPVAEADAVVAWIASEVDNDAHEDEADEGDDLDATKPELELSEDTDTQHVYNEN